MNKKKKVDFVKEFEEFKKKREKDLAKIGVDENDDLYSVKFVINGTDTILSLDTRELNDVYNAIWCGEDIITISELNSSKFSIFVLDLKNLSSMTATIVTDKTKRDNYPHKQITRKEKDEELKCETIPIKDYKYYDFYITTTNEESYDNPVNVELRNDDAIMFTHGLNTAKFVVINDYETNNKKIINTRCISKINWYEIQKPENYEYNVNQGNKIVVMGTGIDYDILYKCFIK